MMGRKRVGHLGQGGMSNERNQENHGRQHRGGARRLRSERDRCHLPDHPLLHHGGGSRRMGGAGAQERLRAGAEHQGAAVGGGSGRLGARVACGRSPHHHLHRLPGAFAHAPQHVQDRRRAAPRRVPRLGPRRRHPRALHLRRPPGRDGGPPHRLRPALFLLGAGGDGPGPGGAPGGP